MIKYALYAKNMHKHEYAEICKKKYAKICKKYANICICPMSLPHLHIYAKICKKICKICKHEIYMHNMPSPLC